MIVTREVTLEELRDLEGHRFAPTPWLTIDQTRISAFAECTLDRQHIHVDPERMRHSPWGTTIAHGFLSLSLTAGLVPPDMPRLRGSSTTLNYGLDRVRFLHPVPAGSQVRFLTRLVGVREKAPGCVVLKFEKTLELRDAEDPAMVAELLVMQLGDAENDDQKGRHMQGEGVLDGKHALVTGGTRGIGFALANGLLAAGARVTIASRRAENVESAATELKEGDLPPSAEVFGIAAHVGESRGSHAPAG